MNRRTIATTAALAAGAFALATTAAQAHVTLQPKQAPAGGFARLDVRVPNEEDKNATTKVVVQMPPGFERPSYEPVPGWRVKASASQITFTAAQGKGIAPGQFRDFGLSVGLPDKPAGTKLTFKALQTYEGGEVVRWIGAPDSDKPAPQVTLVAAPDEHANANANADADEKEDEDDDGNGLAIVALIVGGLGLLVGGAALATRRKAV